MSNEMYEKVLAFARKHGHPTPEKVMRDPAWLYCRIHKMAEELVEFSRACGFELFIDDSGIVYVERHRNGPESLANAVKELQDLQYTVIGTSIALGIRDSRYFDAVHESNMTKDNVGGEPTKGPDYEPPDIEGMLREHGDE